MENTQKTAIVTGASQRIGAGLMEAFLKRGYRVVANSRNITQANPFLLGPAKAGTGAASNIRLPRQCFQTL
jgi:NAD(P)-dependent dehydrogenase (short-subunit alcohol dehydrogenase family)